MEPYEKVERSKKDIIINNFLGGIAWGLGVTVGLTIILAAIGLAFSSFVIPAVNNFISQIQIPLPQANPELLNEIQRQLPKR